MSVENKEYNVNVRISLTRSNINDDYFSISVQDELSRVHVIDVKLSLEDFARAIAACSVQGTARYGSLDRIGFRHEVKRELVPIDRDWGYNQWNTELKKSVKPFEIDGWIATIDSHCNHHYLCGRDKYEVHFHRWVKP
jgi:hypothetical protein